MNKKMRSGRGLTSIFAGTALIAMASWGCGSPSQNDTDHNPPEIQHNPQAAYAPDSLIVRFRSAPAASSARSLSVARSLSASRVKGSILDKNQDGVYDGFAHIANGELAFVKLEPGASVDKALELLRHDPAVLYAEPNYIVHLDSVPNDPRFSELYGMNNTGQTGGTGDADIDAVEAWDTTVGSSDVIVGVIDTGVDYNHEDLAANIWTNPGEIAGNGIDDDANGVIDDVHGFNAFDMTGDPIDQHGHGSHCSGTIGAVGDNGIGVAGVNWHVSVMGLRFLDAGGFGDNAGAIRAIDYAIAQRQRGVNLRVLSASWGLPFDQALLDAINAAGALDILFVASAGNSSQDNDITPHYPSSYDAANIVAVAATDHNDALASFSCFGRNTVDLGAPGVNVLSTTPGNTYSVFSGTSMATPHVAGVAALVLSANNTLGVAELKDILLTSGDPLPSLEGKTVSGRRLNAANAVALAGPPVPHFNLGASPASQVVTQGDSTSFAIDVSSVAGFTGDVSFSVASVPAFDGTLAIEPAVVATPGTATLAVGTTLTTAPGTYNLTITGVSGALTKSRTVSIRVRRFGTVELPFPSTDTPIAIPDGNSIGITSVITVEQPIDIESVSVDLDITHPFVGDLLVTMTSPDGTTVTLHNMAGGTNLHHTYAYPTEFTGQEAAGDWVLHVTDSWGGFAGTLDSWQLHIVGSPGAAGFNVRTTPTLQTVNAGDATSFGINVGAFGGFVGDVSLSVSSTPALAASISLSPTTVAAPGTSTVSIATDCSTPAGDYGLTITGVGPGGQIKTSHATLRVQATASPPIASFTFTKSAKTFQFSDTSTVAGCGGGSIYYWYWDFGDGGYAYEQNPGHTYAADGFYTVSLYVYDTNGFYGFTTQTVEANSLPPKLAILGVVRNPDSFEYQVSLKWSGAAGNLVELYRNDALADIPDNDGATVDLFRRYQTTYTWKICEQYSTTRCSNVVSIVFGELANANEVKVISEVDGLESVQYMRIEDAE